MLQSLSTLFSVDQFTLFRILCLCSEILPPSKCLYLAFTFSPGLPSAQFELKESPALIKISLKASKIEKGLDEKFAKI